MPTETSDRVRARPASGGHTPGPWTATQLNGAGDVGIEAPKYGVCYIAECYSSMRCEGENASAEAAANGALIAAAPDLLEASQGALDALEYIARVYPHIVGFGVRRGRVDALRAAIAKATGAA